MMMMMMMMYHTLDVNASVSSLKIKRLKDKKRIKKKANNQVPYTYLPLGPVGLRRNDFE